MHTTHHLRYPGALGKGRRPRLRCEAARPQGAAASVTLKVRNEIRKLQENSLLGEYRVHTALLRMGIEVSPATCGRIMAANRELYGLEKPQRQPRPKLEMPFRATRRHQYWSAGAIRFTETSETRSGMVSKEVKTILDN